MKILAKPLAYGGALVGLGGATPVSGLTQSMQAGLTVFFVGVGLFCLGMVFAGLPAKKEQVVPSGGRRRG